MLWIVIFVMTQNNLWSKVYNLIRYALDRFGPVVVGIIGSAMIALGYTAMSFCSSDLWVVALLCIIVVGFGSGAVFMAALGTSITISPTYDHDSIWSFSGGGWGVSIVSAGMSLSVASTVFAENTYSHITGCTQVCTHSFLTFQCVRIHFSSQGLCLKNEFSHTEMSKGVVHSFVDHFMCRTHVGENMQDWWLGRVSFYHFLEVFFSFSFENLIILIFNNLPRKQKKKRKNNNKMMKKHHCWKARKVSHWCNPCLCSKIHPFGFYSGDSFVEWEHHLWCWLMHFKYHQFILLIFCCFSFAAKRSNRTSTKWIHIAHFVQIWGSYNTDPSHSNWGGTILLIFSFSNAASNVFCGIISDYLNTRNIMKHKTFLSMIQFLLAIVFILVGILFFIESRTHSSTLAAGVLMASVGKVAGLVNFFRSSIWMHVCVISSDHWSNVWVSKLWEGVWISSDQFFPCFCSRSSPCDSHSTVDRKLHRYNVNNMMGKLFSRDVWKWNCTCYFCIWTIQEKQTLKRPCSKLNNTWD